MTEYRKKLIEVALPLEAINKASAKEKSIRHGHPSTLHLWWARRPLAACRAVLFASLVDDPDSDPMFGGDEDIAASKRAELFNLIEELVLWENSNNSRVINRARAEIARCVATQKIEEGVFKKDEVLNLPLIPCGRGAADEGGGSKDKAKSIKVPVFEIRQLLAKPEQVSAFLAEHAPPVLDPFCGGGSIPLEAQRLGLRAYASDLNPVPVLITKALIEIPPKFAGLPPVNPEWQKKSKEEKAANVWQGAQGLAEDVRYYGKWMRDEAEKRIGHLYPKVKITKEMANDRPDVKEYVGQELTVIAWLWARTIECPNPSCRERAPLVRSFWLSKRKGREFYAKPILDAAAHTVRFEILTKGAPPKHTTDRTGARCLFCDTFIKKASLRDAAVSRGISEIPLAIVAQGCKNRVYLPGDSQHRPGVARPPVPYLEQPMTNDKRWFSPPLYGMPTFADLFTNRQLLALTTLCDLVREARAHVLGDAQHSAFRDDRCSLPDGGSGRAAYADAIATFLAFCVDKNTLTNCTLATWQSDPDRLTQALGRQALPMAWDFAEANPLSEAGGGYVLTLGSLGEVLDKLVCENVPAGTVKQLDAAAIRMNHKEDTIAISSDPPYYDNIGYADLSDWFYIWLRRTLGNVWPSLFATVLTPKTQELIASSHRHAGNQQAARDFFEHGLEKAFVEMHAVQRRDIPISLFYAFKQAENTTSDDDDHLSPNIASSVSTGWETMLSGLVRTGFTVTGTWPVRTELITSLKKEVSALASSIVLVCRQRPADAPLATRKDFITSLRSELPEALRNLQHGNIAPVDLAQAAIGPGMAVFTRYAKVMESDGSAMAVRTALGLINQALDEVLAEQEGEFDGDTRWALAWFEQFGVSEGPFGVAETLSKAKNTAVNGLVEAGVIVAKSGKVRLVARGELREDWDPSTDERLTVWEIAQHLIRKLEQEGESAAAALVHKLGGMAETARDLAYRLYNICERKKWAEEALAYNGLVIAWPELTKLALAERTKTKDTQQEMF